MYVKDRMTKNPLCIEKTKQINKVLDIMAKNNFHRIPVIENNKLIGLITEGVISDRSPSKATSLSIYELNYLLSKTNVEEIMIKEVITIGSEALLEEAAMLMRKNNINCLVVVDTDVVTGIITNNDIFEAFVDLLGYYEQGYRFVIEVEDDKEGILSDISSCFFKDGAFITNLAVYHANNKTEVVIRARCENSTQIIADLQGKNYTVVECVENKIKR